MKYKFQLLKGPFPSTIIGNYPNKKEAEHAEELYYKWNYSSDSVRIVRKFIKQ